MRKNIQEILQLHKLWLHSNSGEKANLHGANLHGADLRGANLHSANLRGAHLHGADLRSADLCDANLHGADLCDADLRSAGLCGANLRSTNLHGTNLHGADLCNADLRGANFDYSSGLPLHCGGAHFKADVALLRQLMAHAVTLDCKDAEWLRLRKAILPFAMKSHRAADLELQNAS